MRRNISVVIPTYNSRPFLAETLRSVFEQSWLPAEIVVADDCSSDGTPDFVEALAGDSPVPLRVMRGASNSGGPSGPLNRGIAAATGDLIATLDHDDVMAPRKLERQILYYESQPSVGLVLTRCNLLREEQTESPVPLAKAGEILSGIASMSEAGYAVIRSRDAYKSLTKLNYAVTCSNFLFPKQVWTRVGGFDDVLVCSCDYGFLQKIARYYDIGFIDEVLVSWRYRSNSLYRSSQNVRQVKEVLWILRRFDAALFDGPSRERLEAAIREKESEIGQAYLCDAYWTRQSGRYVAAMSRYLKAALEGGRPLQAIDGIAKLPLHWLATRLREAPDSRRV